MRIRKSPCRKRPVRKKWWKNAIDTCPIPSSIGPGSLYPSTWNKKSPRNRLTTGVSSWILLIHRNAACSSPSIHTVPRPYTLYFVMLVGGVLSHGGDNLIRYAGSPPSLRGSVIRDGQLKRYCTPYVLLLSLRTRWISFHCPGALFDWFTWRYWYRPAEYANRVAETESRAWTILFSGPLF